MQQQQHQPLQPLAGPLGSGQRQHSLHLDEEEDQAAAAAAAQQQQQVEKLRPLLPLGSLSRSGRIQLGGQDAGSWEIDPGEMTLGQRIGIGSYGEVYKGSWRGTEVAVKRFLEQNLSPQLVQEFKDEVRLRAAACPPPPPRHPALQRPQLPALRAPLRPAHGSPLSGTRPQQLGQRPPGGLEAGAWAAP
jgi:hypothetical protein